MFEAVLSISFAVVLFVVLGTFAYAAYSAAPWVPLRKRDIDRMIKFADIKQGDIVYDLGCGDARILIAVAKQTGAVAIGYEVAIISFLAAKLRVLISGLSKRVKIKFASLYSADISQADVILCFLTPYAMTKLEPKVCKELKAGARFLTYAFPLPNRAPTKTEKDNSKTARIYLYQ